MPLGRVHRHVRVAEHVVRGLAPVPGDHDAHAAPHEDLVAVEAQGGPQGAGDPGRHLDRHLHAVDVLEQHRELVAAEARQGVALAHARPDAASDLDQHLVAGGVAEAVVDGLEIVEVEQEKGEGPADPPGPDEGVGQTVGEQRAVGEAGQGIVKRLVGEPLFQELSLVGVAKGEHEAGQIGIVQEVGDRHLHEQGAAGLSFEAQLGRPRDAAHGLGSLHQIRETRQVVGLDQRLEPRTREVARQVPENALHRRRLVADHPGGVDEQDHVRGVLDQGGEARLALPRRLPGEQAHVLADRHELPGQDDDGERHRADHETVEQVEAASEDGGDQQAVAQGHREIGRAG